MYDTNRRSGHRSRRVVSNFKVNAFRRSSRKTIQEDEYSWRHTVQTAEVTVRFGKVKSKYTNRKPIYDFILDGIAMFVLSFTVREIITVTVCMTLTLIFITPKIRCKYAHWKAACSIEFVGNSNLWTLTVSEIITIELFDVFDSNLSP